MNESEMSVKDLASVRQVIYEVLSDTYKLNRTDAEILYFRAKNAMIV